MVESAFVRCVLFLLGCLRDFLNRSMKEMSRIAEVGSCLRMLGVSSDNSIFSELREVILNSQRDDGGWTDVEETMWCLYFLKSFDCTSCSDVLANGYAWLRRYRKTQNGWGRNDRDFSRIPLTSLIILLHPEVTETNDVKWLIDEVEEELAGSFFLTYKLSLPIYLLKNNPIFSCEKRHRWLHLLKSQQNEDGGFAPWKNHPVGSEVVSSGYALLAFQEESEYEECYGKCLRWILKNQLTDGSWPYHYIEHGTCVGALAISREKTKNER